MEGGKIDFDQDVPLDREEEISISESPARDMAPQVDSMIDLVFRTRLRQLNPKPPVTVAVGSTVAEACVKMARSKIGAQ